MKPTQQLHYLGQSLWLDNIRRELRMRGTLRHYDDFPVTGLASNPSILDLAIKNSNLYGEVIRQKKKESGKALLFDLVIEDLDRPSMSFGPIHDTAAGVAFGGISVTGRFSEHTQRGYSSPGCSATAQSLH
jgi:transaldolase